MARLLTWAGPPPVAAITGNAPKRAVISGLLPSDRKEPPACLTGCPTTE